MVYSEHDADFKALDSQLNQEASSLDWTRSRGQTLSGHHTHMHSHHLEEEEFYQETSGEDSYSQKLGGSRNDEMDTARSTYVAAAYRRLLAVQENENKEYEFEPDPDDSIIKPKEGSCDVDMEDPNNSEPIMTSAEPDPDDYEESKTKSSEPDPDDTINREMNQPHKADEPDPDDTIAIAREVN